MSRQTLSICMEGIPWVLGNALPSWHDGTLDTGLVESPRINQQIDCLGGVARFDDVEIEILDPLTRWAPLFRVVQPREYFVTSPNPIDYDTDEGITLRSATGLSIGNLLYTEQDTWEIADIDGNDIDVTRQIYTCLEDGWNCRHQTDILTDYTVVVSPDGPPTMMGRMVAIYVDGVLEFLGRIVDASQTGRSWRVRMKSILDVLAEAIEPPSVGLKLRHDWNYTTGTYQAGDYAITCTPSSGRGGTAEQMLADFAVGLTDPLQNGIANGWQWIGNDTIGPGDQPDIADSSLTHGAAQALGTEWIQKNLVGYCTKPLGVEQYGVFYGLLGGTFDYLEASSAHYNGTEYVLDGLLGLWLRCGDQLLFVYSVDKVNGRVYFGYVTDAESAILYRYLSAGFASTVPVELHVAPIVSASYLQEAISDVLTGTGAIGMGLPATLISDAPCVPIGGMTPVWWDWSQGGIDEDLRARGLSLALVDGQYRLRQVLPPILAASTDDLAQSDLLIADVPTVARGHEAPVSSITYANAETGWTVSYTSSTGPGRAAVRTLKLTTNTRDKLSDYPSWARLQIARLRWLAPGAPTITVRLASDILQIGQVVTLDSRFVADGNYKSTELPALVIGRDPVNAEYVLALNIGPQTGAIWALSVEVSLVAGAVITPTNQQDLALFASLVPVGTDVQITEMDGTSQLWNGYVSSYQATTVTLSSSPTIAADEIAILTCGIDSATYGALQDRQVYAADASGEIPDPAVPAKVLT